MYNFTNIISGKKTQVFSKLAQSGLNNFVASAPISALMTPLLNYKSYLDSSINMYDALANGFCSVDEVARDAAEISTAGLNINELINDSRPIQISENSADGLINGFKQALTFSGSSSDIINISTASGLCYAFQLIESNGFINMVVGSGTVPFLWKDNSNKWWIRGIILPVNSQVNSLRVSDTLNDVQKLGYRHKLYGDGAKKYEDWKASVNKSLGIADDCRDVYDVTNIRKALEKRSIKTNSNDDLAVCEHTISLIDGAVAAGTLNGLIMNAISAVKDMRIASYIQEAKDELGKKAAYVKKFLNSLGRAYYEGGFKGVIKFLLNVIRTNGSITNSDGTLSYSDNSAIMAKEYIAGIVSTVIAGIGAIVSAVLAAINPIVGLIAALLTTLTVGIVNSFKQDYSDTRASVLSFLDDDEHALSVMPTLPIGLFHGSFTSNETPAPFGWYKDFYQSTGSCAVIDVPGGQILIGPKAMSSDNPNVPAEYMWEFHPFGKILRPAFADSLKRDLFGAWSYPNGTAVRSQYAVGELYTQPHEIFKLWYGWMDEEAAFIEPLNQSNGVLSDHDDISLRMSVALYISLFILWMTGCYMENGAYTLHDLYTGVVSQSQHWVSFWTSASGMEYDRDNIASFLLSASHYVYGNISENNALSWNAIISGCNDINDNGAEVFLYSWDNSGPSSTPHCYGAVGTSIGTSPNRVFVFGLDWGLQLVDFYPHGEAYSNWRCYGLPRELPAQASFLITMPKYNKSTFWTYVVLTAIVTTVVVVVTVVATVKFTQWRKRKRAENVAKFNAAQSEYQSALVGERSTIDPNTGQVVTSTFDTTSPEGQAYIKSCYKNYRVTARNNNLWAKIIGGSRYDITTFYGEADSGGEASSPSEKANSAFASLFEDSEDSTQSSLLGRLDLSGDFARIPHI